MQNYSGEVGLQYHLQIRPGDVGRYVILPGDPKRCAKIAKHFDNAQLVADSREYITYTGYLDGEKVSVTSTGIGGPSASIALEELVLCGADTFIRVGTSGGIDLDVKSGDIVVVLGLLWLLSWDRKAINWKLVIKAIIIQFILAIIIIKVPLGRKAVSVLSDGVTAVVNCGRSGLAFVFGDAADSSKMSVFFVQSLGCIVFVSALVEFLYYVGALGFVVKWLGKAVGKLMGTFIESLDPRFAMVASISLAGFANVSSMGICVGGIGVLCPEKRGTLSRLVLRAMLGGMLVSILSAIICGIVALF